MNIRKGILAELIKIKETHKEYTEMIEDIFERLIYHYEIEPKDGKLQAKCIELLIKESSSTFFEIAFKCNCSESKLKRDIKKYNEVIENIINKEIDKDNKRYKKLRIILKNKNHYAQ